MKNKEPDLEHKLLLAEGTLEEIEEVLNSKYNYATKIMWLKIGLENYHKHKQEIETKGYLSIMKTKKVYTTAYTKGGLKECMETEQPISDWAATFLISTLYKFYAYDERIKAKRYIIKNIKDNLGLPTWIHEYEMEIIENNGEHNPTNK